MFGNNRLAERLMADAYIVFVAIEHVYRAAIAAHALYEVTGDEQWLQKAREHAAVFPRSGLVSYFTP